MLRYILKQGEGRQLDIAPRERRLWRIPPCLQKPSRRQRQDIVAKIFPHAKQKCTCCYTQAENEGSARSLLLGEELDTGWGHI